MIKTRSFLLLLLLLPFWFLVSSTLLSFSHGASSSCRHHQSTIQFQGIRRQVLEAAQNGTLVLAAERTHRRDPLNHFDYYTGGWNVTDAHYVSSVAFSAAPLIGIAGAWFVLLGLFLFCACLCCCCCGCGRRPFGYSRACYALSLIFLLLFTIAAIAGCAMLYTGQGQFYNSVENTFTYLVQQGKNVLTKLQGLWNSIQSAKEIQLDGHYLLPPGFRQNIEQFNSMIQGTSTLSFPDRVSNQTIHYLTQALNPMRHFLNVIAGVMLGFAFLGFVFSIFGLRFLVYTLVIIGWILVTATFLLSAVFLVFHNIVADTCVAMDQWVQNPAAESALSQLLPCMDPQTVDQTLNITRHVTFTTVDLVNVYITNVSNHEFPPNAFPFYHNQSGPGVPLLCNPLTPDMNPRTCAPGEVGLGNASEEYKTYVCQVTPTGICTTEGRLTPASYDQLVGAADVGYTLDHYGPFLASLVDCSFVRDTFEDISQNHCPGLSLSSQWIYAGLVSVSGAVMLSLIFWLLYVRERRHRVYTKKSLVEMSRL